MALAVLEVDPAVGEAPVVDGRRPWVLRDGKGETEWRWKGSLIERSKALSDGKTCVGVSERET